MGALSDEEINEIWKLIHRHQDWAEEERVEFTNGFQEGWNDAKKLEFPVPFGEMLPFMNGVKSTKDVKSGIRKFSNCLGTIVGMFEFHPEEILKNPHYYIACINVLKYHNTEFRDFYMMIKRVVGVWKKEMKSKLGSLNAGQKKGYYDFLESDPS